MVATSIIGWVGVPVSGADRRTVGRRLADRERDAARASNETVGRLLHDARQQAAAISALVTVMHGQQGEPAQDTMMSYLSRAAAQLLRCLDTPTDGRPAREWVPLWKTVEDIVVAAELASPVNVDVEVDESARVFVDSELLRRTVSNLLENAVRAAGVGGRVRFGIERGAANTSIVVEDSGPGFGAGPRGRDSLGLGVVTEFIGSAHGTIEIRRGELAGALFRVTLPDWADEDALDRGACAGLAV